MTQETARRIERWRQYVALYFDVARSARPSQAIGRLRRLVPPRLIAAGIASDLAVAWAPSAPDLSHEAPPYGLVPAPHETRAFEAYGACRRFPSARFWDSAEDGLLFLFFLHGFDELLRYATQTTTADGDSFWRSVVESWLATQDRPRRPSWHPYPTSRRVMAWSTALSYLEYWPVDFKQRVAIAVYRQARYLRRTIERDIGGNHVLTNATALCFAGAVVPASGMLDIGLRILRTEASRQFLPDGGHEERSTSYHRKAVGELAAVRRLLMSQGRFPPAWLDEVLARASCWQEALTGPDGRIPLMGDSWEGPPLNTRTQDSVTVLADSGYVILRDGDDQMVIDAGALCPPHLPAHAHADCLSFVLWLDGMQVIVDPGAYAYAGEARDAFRGTAAHNTVEIAGQNQCVFWGPFRASFLPRVTGPCVRQYGEITVVEASHDGYRRLKDPVIHHRTFIWSPRAGIVILDMIACRCAQETVSRLCLSPNLLRPDPFRLGPLSLKALDDSAVCHEQRQYSPALGVRRGASGVAVRRTTRPGEPFGWTMLRDGATFSLSGPDQAVIQDSDGNRTMVALKPT